MGLSNLAAVFVHYWDLGFTSFGGPGVHVVVLRRRFVDKLKWVDDTTFVDLFALGNALPGPGSTQLAFSIAVVTHGVAAGLLGFMLWSLPGALGMAGLGAGVAHIPDVLPPLVLALLTGLNAAAVGLIALAAVQLATASATDRLTLLLLWLTAAFGICYHAPWMYPTLIAAGGITTLVWDFRRVWWRTLTRKRQAEADQVELAAVNGSGTPGSVDGSASAHSLSTSQPTPSPSLALPEPTRQDTGTTARSLLRRSNVPTPAASVAQTPLQDASADPEPAVQRPSLNVVSTPVAIALLFGFVLFLTVPLATRAGLENAGRHVPVGLDVSEEEDAGETSTSPSSCVQAAPAVCTQLLRSLRTDPPVLLQHGHCRYDHLWRRAGRHPAAEGLCGRRGLGQLARLFARVCNSVSGVRCWRRDASGCSLLRRELEQ
jgi:chromate transport protein ChrA